jgi:uncharacterized protein (TIGR02147 family)
MKSKNQVTARPDITSYEDYRDYLKACFLQRKERNPSFSFQHCGNQLKTSKVYLKLVIEKRRHVGLAKISGLWKLFEMDLVEQQYFTVMVLKATTPEKALRSYFDDILGSLHGRLKYVGKYENPRAPEGLKGDEKETVFRGWVNMAIYGLARFDDFQPDENWILGKLIGTRIDVEDIRQALSELIETGSIRQEGKRWVRGEFIFRTPKAFDLDQFKIYNVGLNRVSEVLDDIGNHRPSRFHMMAISLDQKDQEEMFRLFDEFRDKMIALSEASKGPRQVFLISNNIVALSKKPGLSS